ncbi:DUF3887 domain-containing protein [Aquimarina sp. AD10]|uniref:DUF3887 domain-containing protein n=1 Tax=Aquimarina aggregata TaxID=1642818 RepID=A0A163BUE8_9FLAO|nr:MULTISPECIES: DUF3887 domain-containing protein [Aquimarina]AXT63523.1 DUF3887 domain-containing protein [Aquimarina sp. AD10]KZS41787.1 hypothetical protein AWE51_20550 [Aquimarina aggregata]RKM99759.1 DUF3887 domain-containing protein [Aquimarina sp. AD10]
MKYIFLVLICFSTSSIIAQDKATYDKVSKTFQENFNAQNIDAIFDLYTTEMQKEMTKEGVKRFVNGCHDQFGKLKGFTFIEAAEGIYSYDVEFDKLTLVMELQLNKEGKISAIQFQES